MNIEMSEIKNKTNANTTTNNNTNAFQKIQIKIHYLIQVLMKIHM